jgi:hypothetical protein
MRLCTVSLTFLAVVGVFGLVIVIVSAILAIVRWVDWQSIDSEVRDVLKKILSMYSLEVQALWLWDL